MIIFENVSYYDVIMRLSNNVYSTLRSITSKHQTVIYVNMVNVIAESHDSAYNYNILYKMIGHIKNDDAISIDNGFYKAKTGVRKRVIITKGWDFQVCWDT